MWRFIMLSVYLVILSIFDLKEKKVPVLLLAAGSVAVGSAAVYWNVMGQGTWLQTFLGMLPGGILLSLSYFTGKVGYADGIVLLIVGVAEDYRTGLMVLCISLFLASIVSILLLLLRKVQRHTEIPYIPFLTMAFFIKEMLR